MHSDLGENFMAAIRKKLVGIGGGGIFLRYTIECPDGTSCTACGHRMAHRKWKETKQQPGTVGPGNMLGCCLVSFHFLWAILCLQAVQDVPSGHSIV